MQIERGAVLPVPVLADSPWCFELEVINRFEMEGEMCIRDSPFALLDYSIVHNGEISSYDANRRFIEMFGYQFTL